MATRLAKRNVIDMVWALVGLGGPTLLQFFYVIAAARALLAEQFGTLMLCVAIATVASFIAGIGADGVALKAIARDHSQVGRYFGQALSLVFVTSIPVAFFAVLAVYLISPIHVPIWLAVSIASSEVLFGRVAMTCQKIFIAFSRQRDAAIAGTFIPLGRFFSAAFILWMSPADPLDSLATTYFASSVLAAILCFLFTIKAFGLPRPGFDGMNLKEGVSFALSWINGSIQVECDKMILAYFATPAAVGIYSLASRLMDGAFNPPRALRIALQGRMMREGAKGHHAMYRFMVRILPVSIGYGLFAWAAIAILSPYLVVLFGEKYRALEQILPLMGAVPLLRSIADIGGELFVASDRVGLSTIIQISTTLMRVGIGIALISFAGINGAVWSALLATAAAGAVFWSTALILNRRREISPTMAETNPGKE